MKLGLALVLLAFTCEAKVFTRCRLATELVNTRIIQKTFLPSWVCLGEKVSNRNTSLLTVSSGKKKSYGLFQIPQKWCQERRPGGVCNIACESLLDENIKDDTKCANLIVEREGFKYWPLWNTRCKNGLQFITEEIYKCPGLMRSGFEISDDDIEEEQAYGPWSTGPLNISNGTLLSLLSP